MVGFIHLYTVQAGCRSPERRNRKQRRIAMLKGYFVPRTTPCAHAVGVLPGNACPASRDMRVVGGLHRDLGSVVGQGIAWRDRAYAS